MEDYKPDKNAGDNPQESLENDQEEDFATLFEASQERKDDRVERDTKIEGTIVSIGDDWIFVDIGAKSEGVIAREELVDKSGNLDLQVGDRLYAYVVSTREGEIQLSVKMTAAASEEALRDARRSGIPVEGLVVAERKGGYTISLFGKQGFCPYSQIDLQSSGVPEDYIGKRFTFRITEYSDRGRNVVLSRRDILEEERRKKVEQLKESLRPGDLVTGVVHNLAHFGAFVDLGGIQGLIPMSELAWYRVENVSDVLSPGETLTVKILDLDWAHNRISLSRKQTLEDPWSSVAQRYSEGLTLVGTATRLTNFGAFVQLEPGVEGLIHISNLGAGRRINHPSEVVSPREQLEVKVLSVDQDARRIGLELVRAEGATPDEPTEEIKEGKIFEGAVESVKDYGVFVSLPGGKTGLLHVSQITEGRTGDLKRKYPLGSTVQVQVLAVDEAGGKISLSTKSLSQHDEQSQFKEFAAGKVSGQGFGTLGDLLKNKIKG
jgi:small subunit ribosomal protein S1